MGFCRNNVGSGLVYAPNSNVTIKSIQLYFLPFRMRKTSKTIILKIIAVVEKFAGRINIKIKNTGAQSGKIVSLKLIALSFIFTEGF